MEIAEGTALSIPVLHQSSAQTTMTPQARTGKTTHPTVVLL
jgi:hypothetical protein